MRHAKSSWKEEGLPDYDRPLAPRGKKAAHRMGVHLRELGLLPQIVFCSTARRARKTLKRVMSEWDSVPLIIDEPGIYEEDAHFQRGLFASADDVYETAMLVGHFPEIQNLLEDLSGTPFAYAKFSTAAVAVVEFETDRWRDLLTTTGVLRLFVTPADLSRDSG